MRKLKNIVKGIFILAMVSILVFEAMIHSANSSAVTDLDPLKAVLLYSGGNNYTKFMGNKIYLREQTEKLSGDFGALELVPFVIEPTAAFMNEQINMDAIMDSFKTSSVWVFKNKSLKELKTIFIDAGLEKSMCDELLANTSISEDGKGLTTTPPEELMWQLTKENRATLYPIIGENSENEMYNQPLYFNSSHIEDWVVDSGLRKDTIDKLEKLIYTHDGISYISDICLVLPYVNDEDEKVKLLQLLHRTKALDVILKIEQGQDVSKIAEYWGKFGRQESVENMLLQLSTTKNGGQVNISELLPEIPQSRLNTYSGKEEFKADYKDCHWTTINFFNKEADENYYESENLLLSIDKISDPMQKAAAAFGDVVSIFNVNNDFTHSCTYIADNLVLTKNGIGNLNPFIITYLDKTATLYGDKTIYYSRTIGNTHSVDFQNLSN